MKNVSILSKLFLVSAIALPCGQAFSMNLVKTTFRTAKKGVEFTVDVIKNESAKKGFWQQPSVNACTWGLVGAGGSVLYYGLKNLPKKKFKTAMITMGFGTLGYIYGVSRSNGRKLDQVLKNQKRANAERKALIHMITKGQLTLEKGIGDLNKNQNVMKQGLDFLINKQGGDKLPELSDAMSQVLSDEESTETFNKLTEEFLKEEESKQNKSWSYLKPWSWF